MQFYLYSFDWLMKVCVLFILVPRDRFVVKLFIEFLIPRFWLQNSIYLLNDLSVLKSDSLEK